MGSPARHAEQLGSACGSASAYTRVSEDLGREQSRHQGRRPRQLAVNLLHPRGDAGNDELLRSGRDHRYARDTYILISHNDDSYRRIYTDGRAFPEETELTYAGYSIGKWLDEDGDGKYDVLEVETRFLKLPRSYDIAGIPFHNNGQTVIKERIDLDKADRNVLWDQITVIDDALTRPWVKLQKATRNPNPRPVWFSEVCSETNTHVRIENENYFRSADGKLMPSKKDQPPPICATSRKCSNPTDVGWVLPLKGK